MENEINKMFIDAIGNKKSGAGTMIACFRSGKEARYTMRVFDLLKTDPEVVCICDNETGEVIYSV
jgi:hypothetical protein